MRTVVPVCCSPPLYVHNCANQKKTADPSKVTHRLISYYTDRDVACIIELGTELASYSELCTVVTRRATDWTRPPLVLSCSNQRVRLTFFGQGWSRCMNVKWCSAHTLDRWKLIHPWIKVLANLQHTWYRYFLDDDALTRSKELWPKKRSIN